MSLTVTKASNREKDLSFRRGMLHHYHSERRGFPWRDTRNPYAVLVGELLLQRTRAESVGPVYERFIGRWPDASALASADVDELRETIRPLGLGKRAATLRRLGEELRRLGKTPTTPDRLARLPGVGPYAAHAVPIFAGNRNLPLVDWVIARVLGRYYGRTADRRPNDDQELWALAARLASRRRARELWFGTLDFAASVCKPRPRCDNCRLKVGCDFFNGSRTGSDVG